MTGQRPAIRHRLIGVLLLASAACSISLAGVIPFEGEPPEALVFAPVVDMTGDTDWQQAVLSGADAALRRRGYRVLPIDLGLGLLRQSGLEQPARLLAPGLPEVEREIGVDSVVSIVVHRWTVTQSDELDALDFDLEYRIASVRTERVVWRHRTSGHYRRYLGEREDLVGPPRDPVEAETVVLPRPDDRGFVDARAFAAALHRSVFDQVPERGAS